MAFNVRKFIRTRENEAPEKTTALVTVKGSLYKRNLTTGALELAVASLTATEKVWQANEAIAAADNRTNVNATVLNSGDELIADTVNNSSAAHNGQRMVINATGDKLNNTGTDAPAGVFIQVGVIGAAADKKVIARKV